MYLAIETSEGENRAVIAEQGNILFSVSDFLKIGKCGSTGALALAYSIFSSTFFPYRPADMFSIIDRTFWVAS
jgi:hypothetical protein